jgi:hypothetical protein
MRTRRVIPSIFAARVWFPAHRSSASRMRARSISASSTESGAEPSLCAGASSAEHARAARARRTA